MTQHITKKEIEKLIVLRDLFPRSKPNFKTGLTEYQAKKINSALKNIRELYPNTSKIVPMRTGRKAYAEKNGLPSYIRGIPLPGGTTVNTQLNYSAKNDNISYRRAGQKNSHYQLDISDEEKLIASAKKILKQRNHRLATITFFGRALGAVRPTEDDDLLIREMVYYFNKYIKHAGETRRTRDQRGRTVYQTLPEHWDMGILFEGEKYSAI